MNEHSSDKVLLTEMIPKVRSAWIPQQKHTNKRLLRNTAFFAAVSACLGVYTWIAGTQPQAAQSVMSHLTAGFEYDESLGRLQFVSNILPESAMVFLSHDDTPAGLYAPSNAKVTHAWSEKEPWIEFAADSSLSACLSGEIIAIVSNRQGEHTIRMIHDNGYESIYSRLSDVFVKEYDHVSLGTRLGTGTKNTAFELRKDGVSILPVYSDMLYEN